MKQFEIFTNLLLTGYYLQTLTICIASGTRTQCIFLIFFCVFTLQKLYIHLLIALKLLTYYLFYSYHMHGLSLYKRPRPVIRLRALSELMMLSYLPTLDTKHVDVKIIVWSH